jgi:hypothetical protein
MSMRKSICNPPALKAELESLLNAENEEYNQEEEPEYIEDLLNKYDDLIDEFTAVTISESQFRSSKVDDIKTLINFISERIQLENEVVNLYHIIVSNIMEDKKVSNIMEDKKPKKKIKNPYKYIRETRIQYLDIYKQRSENRL